jgi:hypothetical protein
MIRRAQIPGRKGRDVVKRRRASGGNDITMGARGRRCKCGLHGGEEVGGADWLRQVTDDVQAERLRGVIHRQESRR